MCLSALWTNPLELHIIVLLSSPGDFHADLIGAHSVAGSNTSSGADKTKYRFFGDFDDIRIWNSVRTSSQIKKNMARGTRLGGGGATEPHLQHQWCVPSVAGVSADDLWILQGMAPRTFDDGTVKDTGAAVAAANFTELVGEGHIYCS
jgi:hypothetical protein